AAMPLVFVRSRPLWQEAGEFARRAPLGLALVIGAYDGFFGPGTGALLIFGLVALGRSPVLASAEAKVINLASNLAGFSLFAHRGLVVMKLALPMAAAQLLGGYLGAHTAIRGGSRVVRAALLAVVGALLLKISSDLVAARRSNASPSVEGGDRVTTSFA